MIYEITQIIDSTRLLIFNLCSWLYLTYSWFWIGTWRRKSRFERTVLPSFTKRTRIHDVALVVDKRELWFSRQLLCMHSPYLNARLNSPNGSSHTSPDRVPVSGASYKDVLCLLWCLTPGQTFMRVDQANVVPLGRASNDLEIEEVQKRCEQYLTQQSLSLAKDGDPRVMDLLGTVSQLGYRPLLDYLIVRTADTTTFDQIRQRRKHLPPTVLAALYDVKLRGYTRWSHDWRPTSAIKPDEYCDCGDEPFDSARRCGKCKKICCDQCYESNGLGTMHSCISCSDCGGELNSPFKSLNGTIQKKVTFSFQNACGCSRRALPGFLDDVY